MASPSASAAARVERDAVVDALQRRFDHASAATVFAECLRAAKLTDKGDYTVEEVSRLAWTLHGRDDRAIAAAQALLELASRAASAGDPVLAEEAAELDGDPEWERVDTVAIGAMLQSMLGAAVELARERGRAGSAIVARAGEAAERDDGAATPGDGHGEGTPEA